MDGPGGLRWIGTCEALGHPSGSGMGRRLVRKLDWKLDGNARNGAWRAGLGAVPGLWGVPSWGVPSVVCVGVVRAFAHVQSDPHVDVVRCHRHPSRHEGFPGRRGTLGKGDPDARAAPTLRRDLRHAPRIVHMAGLVPISGLRASPLPATTPPGSSMTGQESHTGTGDPAPTIRDLPNMVMGVRGLTDGICRSGGRFRVVHHAIRGSGGVLR